MCLILCVLSAFFFCTCVLFSDLPSFSYFLGRSGCLAYILFILFYVLLLFFVDMISLFNIFPNVSLAVNLYSDSPITVPNVLLSDLAFSTHHRYSRLLLSLFLRSFPSSTLTNVKWIFFLWEWACPFFICWTYTVSPNNQREIFTDTVCSIVLYWTHPFHLHSHFNAVFPMQSFFTLLFWLVLSLSWPMVFYAWDTRLPSHFHLIPIPERLSLFGFKFWSPLFCR